MPEMRYFNEAGRARWNEWLILLRDDSSLDFPEGLLTNPDLTRRAPGAANVEAFIFDSKYELAKRLSPMIAIVRKERFPAERWPGLWDWLAAFHFDSICPTIDSGMRSIREHARYYLASDYKRRYRHRIFGPVDLYTRLGDSSRLLIHGEPATVSDWEEQTASRYQISSNKGIADALYRLYWDETKGAPKRGAAPNKRTPGTLRRFSDLVQQLDRTYDLVSVQADAILDLLPKEFGKFRQ